MCGWKQAREQFVISGWEFGGQASGAARAGDKGGSYQGAMSVSPGVWVYQRTGSVSSFALISVAALPPGILLAPLAGAVADRWDRRKLMMVAKLVDEEADYDSISDAFAV